MPIVSKAQARLMYAALKGHLKAKGPSKEVAKEFIEATPKASFKKLKEYVNGKPKKAAK